MVVRDTEVNSRDYGEEKQKLLICVLLSSEDIFARCVNILHAKYFVNKLRPAVRFILKHADEYRVLPKIQQVNAETGLDLYVIDDISPGHADAFLDEIEEFCKNRALADAVLASADLIDKGNYGEVEKLVRDAILVSLQSDIGTDYFADPRSRLLRIKDKNGQVSTGWKTVDDKLYGGINRGEITIFAAGSGVGKSLFLQNASLNLVKQGLNVVYITLELSEELTSMRMDSMLTEVSSKEIFRNLDTVELKIKAAQRKSGLLHVRQLPQGSTCNDIKAYLKNYEIETQKRCDVLIVDYLDLLYPNNNKVNPSDLFIKDKFVTEELRGLAVERNMVCITASQLNRSATQEQEHDQSMIAGGISKIQTADNVISIFASAAMKERGQYQIQFLKTRSSSGVGSKVYLGFDQNTLKIFDLDDEQQSQLQGGGAAADVFKDLRRKNAGAPVDTPAAAVKSDVNKNMATLSSLTSLIRR
jgi:KaiC/GvpD/RAD55 family RecA-like ATPase